ncbi:hypothetical protein RchiOBHm_Chr7g0203141 [Rosa chinensis]|uniref:Uncharacterized protein n=1 Tax=Rosa chinensis TaxID=74649 RepID=A0A2P6P8B3_ROSCH|nr:hypothetical protein RchiOBHm_Chr7g0203141 [Rosa chinensis]
MSIFLQHAAHTWDDTPKNNHHGSPSDEHCNNQRVAVRLAKNSAIEADEPGSPYKKGSYARLKLKRWMARIKHGKSKVAAKS